MRRLLTWMSALLVCGCLGRAKPDLLQARLREQQEHIAQIEQQMASTQSELERSRRDSEQLRAELARSGKQVVPAEYSESLMRVRKLTINSLMSGGLNRDDRPGDDALVALISLVDDDSEVVKLPGSVELTLIDPALPEPNRQVGHWQFKPDECRAKWTRGFAGVGYQFTVPLDHPVQHSQLVLYAKLTAADGRAFDSNQLIRVTPAKDVAALRVANAADQPEELDDINDPPPAPVQSFEESPEEPDWSRTPEAGQKPVLESSSFKKDQFPQYR